MGNATTRTITFFDPAKIAISGQAFRWHIIDDTHTELVAFGRYLQIAALGEDRFALSCTEKEFESVWQRYFHLDFDYPAAVASIPSSDSYLTKAAEFSYGIRILRQEPWEALISYIISQRRSIPSIMTSVERLCEACGRKIRVPSHMDPPFVSPSRKAYYSFPSRSEMSAMTLDDITSLGVGYRASYIDNTVKLDPPLDEWNSLTDDELFAALTSLKGVGKKVADCVMLFSFGRCSRFPVDVWIGRIQDRYYGGSFDTSPYPDSAGIMQQFMFFYERCRNL
ncbi:MAG: DNA-3-methyladenine glycosylase 2 family protein [Clostridiales bacterium]|nr:DNA-3-methyladenine glycosylase 2 family protein [Clostridiales bacterium]